MKMANVNHLAKLSRGVWAWNEWRRDHSDVIPDLHEAKLSSAQLESANLRNVRLRDAELIGANLRGADLSGADLRGADLSTAYAVDVDFSAVNFHETRLCATHLRLANLSHANLCHANLCNATLVEVNMHEADLRGADLQGASISGILFGNTNLRGAKGLAACTHLGPSILDYQTLTRHGHLPLEFLRGCGLPDELIEYVASLPDRVHSFYSCFISYSTEDHEFAEVLHADLQNRGVRCWFAPHDLRAGEKIHEQLQRAIRLYDRLLLILSEHSMSSEWVKTEISYARQREVNERRRVLFPISLVPFATVRQWRCFDADSGNDSAREIRQYFIPDFSRWKDQHSYRLGFERLLNDLNAERGNLPEN